jgi:Bacteriophage baseplate protein W
MTIKRQDYAFPFRIDSASLRTAQSGYVGHVEQMIWQLLLTSPGERVDLPQFGCGLRSLIFAPNSDALAATVQLRVVVGGPDGAPPEPATLQVTITYTLVETQTSQSVTVAIA